MSFETLGRNCSALARTHHSIPVTTTEPTAGISTIAHELPSFPPFDPFPLPSVSSLTLVQLTIDVRSHGDPRSTSEVTWWEIELLDEALRPLPFHERELVDLGREMRLTREWTLEGSPVIFKLTSGSDAGDTVRIRFVELE